MSSHDDWENWFAVRRLPDDVFLISEPGYVNCFLVLGTQRALLVDSGLGLGPLRETINRITELPVLVVNTHSHFDHVGGNREFDETAIHPSGRANLLQPVSGDTLGRWRQYMESLVREFAPFRAIDDDFFFFLTAETSPRPLPTDLDWSKWAIGPFESSTTVSDGDVIDLGQRRVTILHTPGHSSDSICLIDRENGILFAGDTVNTGPIYLHLADSDTGAFERSAMRLREEASHLRVIYVAHFSRYAADSQLLEELAAGVADLIEKRVHLERGVDWQGAPVLVARFRSFSIAVQPREYR